MLYAIICEDAPNSLETRLKTRPAHLERLQALNSQGHLVLAGPHPVTDTEDLGDVKAFSGSLIVAEFPSLAQARAWAEADPYNEAGVYARVTVKPFKKVLP